MSKYQKSVSNWLQLLSCTFVLYFFTAACTGSDFSGSSGSKNGSTRPQNDSLDGVEGDESKVVDGKDDKDGNDDKDDTDDDESDDGDDDETDDGEPEGGSESDDNSKKTRSDLKIVQTRESEDHQIKVELMVDGKATKSQQGPAPGKDKELIFKDMCRIGLKTCLKVTFIGEITQVAGSAKCVFTSPVDATSVKLDVDTNGSGVLGSCKPDEDETFVFSCAEAQSLEVQGCNK
jgi:hypothetical protein